LPPIQRRNKNGVERRLKVLSEVDEELEHENRSKRFGCVANIEKCLMNFWKRSRGGLKGGLELIAVMIA
jgi:hypothetical protein